MSDHEIGIRLYMLLIRYILLVWMIVEYQQKYIFINSTYNTSVSRITNLVCSSFAMTQRMTIMQVLESIPMNLVLLKIYLSTWMCLPYWTYVHDDVID